MNIEILTVKNLTVTPKNAPNRYLVNNASFQLSAGKTTCIVGESGSGKSLTALSMMGLLSHQTSLPFFDIVLAVDLIWNTSLSTLRLQVCDKKVQRINALKWAPIGSSLDKLLASESVQAVSRNGTGGTGRSVL